MQHAGGASGTFEWKALPRYDVSLLGPGLRMRHKMSSVSAQFLQRLKTKQEGKQEKGPTERQGVLPFPSNVSCPFSASVRVGMIGRGALCGHVRLCSQTPLHSARRYREACQ